MSDKLLDKVKELASTYENLDVHDVKEDNGQVTLTLGVKGNKPEYLPENFSIVEEAPVNPGELTGSINNFYASGSTPNRLILDTLRHSDLDLARTPASSATPKSLFARSLDYYRTKDVYGTSINVLTNFASKGFENDIDDPTIKNFYDNWVIDSEFDRIVDKAFFDFFRVGMVRTYKILGKYEPKVNYLSPLPGQKPKKVKKATAAQKNRYSKSHIPIAYTVLNPCYVEIKGSLLFGQTATFLNKKAGEELKPLLEMKKSDLSTFQRKIIEAMPSSWKKAILEGDDIPLDKDLVGEIDYRRMPYERYPIPRGARAFESIEFKNELRKADYSTLDGITNYILKITVGNDTFPVKNQDVLDTVSRLFDTVQKSFKVVWNHTLNVEKITSPEIGEVLGQEKYTQVNEDITGALGIVRALLDGGGNLTPAAADLAVKSLIEEINYARKEVKHWIYKEYRAVAEAVGFDRFPKVRFDDMALRDELAMMSIIQGMIDRRIISYHTGQQKLGFDPATELSQMEEEKPLIQNGTLGLVGSPFQQSGNQPTQRTPKGTPSEGRPKGQPAKKPVPKDKSAPPKPKKKTQLIDNNKAKAEFVEDCFKSLSLDELEAAYIAARELKLAEEDQD